MNKTFTSNLLRRMLPMTLLVFAASWQVSAQAANVNCANGSCVFGGAGGDNALSREEARENKEQWDATRNLRKLQNQRAEKEFVRDSAHADKQYARDEKDSDKQYNAKETRDSCNASSNVGAYWEPNTQRCLDRRTGRELMVQ